MMDLVFWFKELVVKNPAPWAGFFTPLETSAAHNGDESYSFFSKRAF